jgi:sortase (surface protein transpeptidase)
MRLVVLALLVLAGAVGCAAPAAVPAAAPVTATVPIASPQPVPVPPTHVRIPSIGVDSALIDLGVDATGALVPPESAAVAGWFAGGPEPGDDGPALLAGHVDSRDGPGVFYRLRELEAGDRVEVARADGSTVVFIVTRVTQTAKTAFPTRQVYAPTPGPELRLVTCGGTFDRSVRSYRDNIVVEAVPAVDVAWTVP